MQPVDLIYTAVDPSSFTRFGCWDCRSKRANRRNRSPHSPGCWGYPKAFLGHKGNKFPPSASRLGPPTCRRRLFNMIRKNIAFFQDLYRINTFSNSYKNENKVKQERLCGWQLSVWVCCNLKLHRNPAGKIKTTSQAPSLISSPLSWLLGRLVSGCRNALRTAVEAVALDLLWRREYGRGGGGGGWQHSVPPYPSPLPRRGGGPRECWVQEGKNFTRGPARETSCSERWREQPRQRAGGTEVSANWNTACQCHFMFAGYLLMMSQWLVASQTLWHQIFFDLIKIQEQILTLVHLPYFILICNPQYLRVSFEIRRSAAADEDSSKSGLLEGLSPLAKVFMTPRAMLQHHGPQHGNRWGRWVQCSSSTFPPFSSSKM